METTHRSSIVAIILLVIVLILLALAIFIDWSFPIGTIFWIITSIMVIIYYYFVNRMHRKKSQAKTTM